MLKDLIAYPLEIKVFDHNVASNNEELGSAAFNLSELAKKDFVSTMPLGRRDSASAQGSLSIKVGWGKAEVIKSGDLYAKFKGVSVVTMGKYVKHTFSLWCAHNLNDGGLMDGAEWKSYRLAYFDKNGVEVGYILLGLDGEILSKYEFQINTLDAITAHPCHLSVRCEGSTDYKEWTALIKKVEDPKLTSNRSSFDRGRSSGSLLGRQPSFGKSPLSPSSPKK